MAGDDSFVLDVARRALLSGQENDSDTILYLQAILKDCLKNPVVAYTVRIPERDEAGARALSELRDRGVNEVANALAQSVDHVLGFFEMLRAELAFYVGCLNLHDRLKEKGEPVAFPGVVPAGQGTHRFVGLYDVCLSLSMAGRVVGNAADAAGKQLVIISGANQGGKSSFLRSIGQAQLMMQCGMFVASESFEAGLCAGLFTHYRREEDIAMNSGKLDEELARLSDIIDHLAPAALLLCNESFAATNEREGSEIARQIVRALVERGIRVFFVTHLYDFAQSGVARKTEDVLFLRAERRADGTRTFRLVEGEPLDTSFGEDLYYELFPPDDDHASSRGFPRWSPVRKQAERVEDYDDRRSLVERDGGPDSEAEDGCGNQKGNHAETEQQVLPDDAPRVS